VVGLVLRFDSADTMLKDLMNKLNNSETLHYPLALRFKLLAISNQFELLDGQGQMLGYVRQPWAKIREAVSVFSDKQQAHLLFTIKADRILDFGARYAIATAEGSALGELKREAVKSFFKASYRLVVHETGEAGAREYTIVETNPWIKVIDGLLAEVPVLGVVTNYFLHPRYAVLNQQAQELLEVRKRPSFFERKFSLNALPAMAGHDEKTIVLACLMMILLEAKRG
jgi:uncharacterized protein YxjI